MDTSAKPSAPPRCGVPTAVRHDGGQEGLGWLDGLVRAEAGAAPESVAGSACGRVR